MSFAINESVASGTMARTAVRIENCLKRLGQSMGDAIEFDLPALTINRAERVALTGPSGCGKSTLLNLIAGLMQPDAGDITVLDTALSSLSRWGMDSFRGASIGFIYQNLNLMEGFSALDNILLGMRFGRKLPGPEQRPRALALLERVGLANRLHLRPSRLSMGERQRVAVARALANRPALLLADEPTGSLDPETADGVFGLIHELCAETGCTLLFVTHDLSLAARLPRAFDCRGLVRHRPLAEAVA